mmetsp:Transcript_8071/g.26805  ORF Transcript_8071/g.26805 Transcript_8071/m.26805 type:complete len:212 (+) Transcript_8071:389-1024(+)
MPTCFSCGTCAPTSTMSVYCLHVTVKLLPRIFPDRCSSSSSSTNRMSSVRWYVYKPASCMGSTQATSADSLWCECHHPGGVTKTAPLHQSHRIGSMMFPLESISFPISVYTFGAAATARSRATLLCRCARCTEFAGMEFNRDHNTCVRVLVCSHAVFPSNTPRRLTSFPTLACAISSTSANMRSRLNSVGSNFFFVGATPRYSIKGSSCTQ